MKSLLDAMAMNHCTSMVTPGSKGQDGNRTTEELDAKNIESSDLVLESVNT